MTCWSCQGETPADKPFCANCGASLTPRCAACGANLVAGKPFCADCGKATTPAPTTHVATPIESVAERRLCSVLFVDLVGFTPLAEGLDPEQVRELLSEYFDRAQHIIEVYGGTVEKFIGDAVMAVWGAPLANEDDAERAVRAGLDVVASVEVLGESRNLPGLRARGGVVTGEVAVTVGKVTEGMVLGDTVNAASRVQSVATPGTVLVDEATWRAASGAIAFEEVGALELKGKSETVNAWRALRVVAQRKGLGRVEGLEPPFVGRDEELRFVKETLHAVEREGRARLISVMGMPGIGKSRMAWEFLKYVDGMANTVYWHEGRSRAYGEGIAFGALSEMVRMRAGILESEEIETAVAKLRACLEEFIPDASERQWVEPRLAHILGVGGTPSADREELFSAWRRFFERVADVGPTVMIFEDLQWADAGLVDFVESLLEWSRAFPLLVITLARPELRDTRPSWGAGLRNFSALHLDPLGEVPMRTLLEGFVRGLPPQVTDSVLQRAEGVPLYAVETIRMLVDRGHLVADGDHYRVAREIETLEMPETLHALVASRLDALPASQRTLLQDAGVVGSTFSMESLEAVSDATRSSLDDDLRDLVRKEYLFTNTDPRSPERGQYVFVQGVVREVAVGTLARRDRSTKHLRVAHYAEGLNDDELSGVVATHYLEACRSLAEADQSDELRDRALQWLRRAGERSLTLGAHAQAVTFFSDALDLSRDPHTSGELHALAGEGYDRQLNIPDALKSYRRALDLFESLGDFDESALVVDKMILHVSREESADEAQALGERAFAKLPETSVETRARLASAIAFHSLSGERVDDVIRWSEVALDLAERLDGDTGFYRALQARANALFYLGRHREAVVLMRGMIESYDEGGAIIELARAKGGLSVFMLPDDPRAAMVLMLEVQELARQAGRRDVELTNRLNYVETAINLGLFSEADSMIAELKPTTLSKWYENWLTVLESVLRALRCDVNDEQVSPYVEVSDESLEIAPTQLTGNAVIALVTGDWSRAHRDAHEVVRLEPTGFNTPFALGVDARAALWLGDLEALKVARGAMDRIRGRMMTANRRTADAAIAGLEGRLDDAAEIYREATDRWRDLGSRFELALCQLDSVKVLGSRSVDATAAQEAREAFAVMGAPRLLQRLDDVLSAAVSR